MIKLSTIAAAALLATAAAHAQSRLDVYAAPNNYTANALSAGGLSAVSSGGGQNVYLGTSPGTWAATLGGNSTSAGFAGSLGISGNGMTISGNATAGNGYSQAATYDVATGTWKALGSLGFNGTSVVAGLQQQSSANAISADGSTMVGQAYFNTTGTTGTRTHPVVFRNGQTYDLNPSGTTQTGTALSTNGNGTLIGGYNANSAVGSLWSWNGAGYTQLAAPTINNAAGNAVNIQTTAISNNGRWVAGGSVNGLAVTYGGIGSGRVFSQATLWDTTTQSGLLIPFDHVINTTADIDLNMKATVTGVSDAGLVIGAFNLNLGNSTGLLDTDTWIYDAATGTSLSFDSYLASLGLGLTSTQHVWSLSSMSADGTAIAGAYFDTATSQTSGFILHIAAVPEPSTWALFALALPLLAGRVLRRRRQAA